MKLQNIKTYLEGKTTEQESAYILNWLKNPGHEEECRKILGEIWVNHDMHLRGTKPDFDQMLHQIHHQINLQEIPGQLQKAGSANKMTRFYLAFSKIAAILIIPLLLVSIWMYLNKVNTTNLLTSVSVHEIYTKPGTRTKIDLSDGTKVWLNDGTTFRYPELFTGENREVFVDGEAYFEVRSNPQKPFVVDNKMIRTVVTGTHFNINGYAADQFFEATLSEGKVSLEKDKQNFSMSPGEQVQYDALTNVMIKKNVNPENAVAWINGMLIFKDEKLETAIKKLGRWYNVEIILSDKVLNNYLLTGTFQHEQLDQTLKLISLALPVRFEYEKVTKPSEIQRTIYMRRK